VTHGHVRYRSAPAAFLGNRVGDAERVCNAARVLRTPCLADALFTARRIYVKKCLPPNGGLSVHSLFHIPTPALFTWENNQVFLFGCVGGALWAANHFRANLLRMQTDLCPSVGLGMRGTPAVIRRHFSLLVSL